MNKVVYVSRGGNTKKMADAIAKGAGATAEAAPGSKGTFADVLFVGGSIYAGKMDKQLREYLEALTPQAAGKVVVFGTAAGVKSLLSEVQSMLLPKGIAVDGEAFQCKGSFLLANRGRPNVDDIKAAEEFARKKAARE